MYINETHSYLKITSFMKMIAFGLFLSLFPPVFANAQGSTLAGNPEAIDLFSQAKAYHDGDGVEQDLAKALELYTKSAALGNVDARVNLGYMYFVGEGVLQNYDIARSYYLVAASAGDATAQKNLGAMYEHGLGVSVSKDTAQLWYDKSDSTSAPKKPSTRPAKKIAMIDTPASEPSPKPTPQEAITPQTVTPTQTFSKNTSPTEMALPLLTQSLSENAIEVQTRLENIQAEPPLRIANTVSTAPSIVVTPLLKNTSLLRGTKWTRYIIGASLFLTALIATIWYVTSLRKIYRAKHRYSFASNFFAHHRKSLRGSYLRTPQSQRMFLYPRDPWAVSVCSLMVRYAVQQHNDPEIKCKTSTHIVNALKKTPYQARLTIFPLVALIQERLFADIKHLNKETIHPPKPFQFNNTNFLQKNKREKLGNTRPAELRLVK